MSTYTKTTNFTAKDNLTSGDPAKVIKGSEFDTEFNSIETAVNSKADANNGTHTGTTTISTADIDTLQIDSVEVTATSAELNTLDGITSTTAELNKLDGFTGTVDDLNYAKDLRATGVTATELDKIDGLTADSTELNILDGATVTTAELNTLDGITASTAELNVTDGLTATTAELNTLDGITSTTAELNVLDGITATTAELNVLDGVTSTTAEINKLDGFTGTVDDLNYAKDLRATGVTTAELDVLDGITATTTELNYTDGVTSSIQTQLNGKATTAQGALADSAVQPDDNVSFGTGSFSGAVDVTGTVTADALTVDAGVVNQVASFSSTDAGAFVYIQDNNALGYYHGSSSGTYVVRDTDNKNRINISSDGNVSFYEDTGTTAKMVWSSSNERLSVSSEIQLTNVNGKISWANGFISGGNSYGDMRHFGDRHRLYSEDGSKLAINVDIAGNKTEFYTNGTERMRINSSGYVGINTASPSTGLMLEHSNNGATLGTIRIKDRDSQQAENQLTGAIEFESQDATIPTSGVSTAIKAYSASSTGGSYLTLSTTDINTSTLDERMRIDSSGKVGIGESDPSGYWSQSNQLVIEEGNAGITIKSSSAGNGRLVFTDTKSTTAGLSDGGMIAYGHSTDVMTFQTNGAERARIDSSGNLLVGTTDRLVADGTGTGLVLGGQSDLLHASRSGGDCAKFNRVSNDGSIVTFAKDGSTVGSIGTKDYDLYIGRDASGLLFDVTGDDGIRPFNVATATESDAALDLGSASARFKDLYLSGGVYLGGTGAANKLDDYETGDFTVTTNGDATGTFTSEDAQYTKIGRLVTVQIVFDVGISFTGDTISGLPFVAADSVGVTSIGQSAAVLCNTKASDTIHAAVVEGSTAIRFYGGDTTTSHSPNSTQNVYRVQLSYIANS